MKKQEGSRAFKSISILLLSIIVVLIIIAMVIKIGEYKRSFYTLDTKFKTNNIVQLNNKLPMSDEIGKSFSGTGMEKGIAEYKEFTISNPNEKEVKYEIYLTKTNSNTNNIRSNYVKLYLTDEDNNPIKGFDKKKVVSFYDLYSLSDKPGSRLLYNGSLAAGSSKTYILRSWIADTYILSSEEEVFNFDITVRLK